MNRTQEKDRCQGVKATRTHWTTGAEWQRTRLGESHCLGGKCSNQRLRSISLEGDKMPRRVRKSFSHCVGARRGHREAIATKSD